MFRLKVLLIAGGIGLGFFGWQEYKLGAVAKQEASELSLAELEGMDSLENAHIRLGEHEAVYGGLVYSYTQEDEDAGEPSASDKVSLCFYPIISSEHPFMKALTQLDAEYPDGIPDEVEFPALERFQVIVQTDRFKTVGDIPDGLVTEGSLQGLVVNEIETLSGPEADLILESFPNIDMEKVFLLEEGRTPVKSGSCLAMIGGGGLLLILGVVWTVSGFRKKGE